MGKTAVIYWSSTGNTETMANAIAAGLKQGGQEVEVFTAADAPDVADYDKVAFGCPSMGDETLEESEFEPFYEAAEAKVSGKKVALFGSYGWGDGQWMRDWQKRAEDKGAVVFEEGFIQNYEPDEAACTDFGTRFAAF